MDNSSKGSSNSYISLKYSVSLASTLLLHLINLLSFWFPGPSWAQDEDEEFLKM